MATIINNSAVTLKSDILAPNPYIYVADPEKGKPLSGAQVYFGVVGKDPQLPENQKNVFALQENGTAVSVEQPVITGAGGIPMYNGSPVPLAVDGSFSYKVLDSSGAQVYYVSKVTTPNLLGYSGVVLEEAKTYTSVATLTYDVIETSTSTFYAATSAGTSPFNGRLMRKDVDYSVGSPTTITLLTSYPSGTVILGRQMDPTGESSPVVGNVKTINSIDTVAIAKGVDLALGDIVTINGKTSLGDGLGGEKYVTVTGGSGVADDENYINLDNGYQLQLIPSDKVLKKYAQTTSVAPINSGELTLNVENGMDFTVTLNQNVSNVIFQNVNQAASTISTVTLKVKQGPSTLYNITWPSAIKWAGGSSPTVTATANREDIYGFVTYDKGSTWYGAIMGQNYAV